MKILHPQEDCILKRDVPVGVNSIFDAAIKGYEGTGETVNSRGVQMLISMQLLFNLQISPVPAKPHAGG
jgi:hypothetical protein